MIVLSLLSTSSLLIMVSSCSLPKGNVLWQFYFYCKKINWHCSLYVTFDFNQHESAFSRLINLTLLRVPRICPYNAEDYSPYPIPWLNKHCKGSFQANVYLDKLGISFLQHLQDQIYKLHVTTNCKLPTK